MISSAQLQAVHAAAEVAEKRLGHIFEAMELLASDINNVNEPRWRPQINEWVVVLKWLSGSVSEEEGRLYQALQHDAVETVKRER